MEHLNGTVAGFLATRDCLDIATHGLIGHRKRLFGCPMTIHIAAVQPLVALIAGMLILLAEDTQRCHRYFARFDQPYRPFLRPLQRSRQSVVLLPGLSNADKRSSIGARTQAACYSSSNDVDEVSLQAQRRRIRCLEKWVSHAICVMLVFSVDCRLPKLPNRSA